MKRYQTSLTALERSVRTAAESWPTTLLGICQIASESIFNSRVTAAGRFAPALDVPEHFLVQLLHIEDKRFLLHPGVDPFAIVRAVVANGTRSGVTQGASTITQQLYNVRWNAKGVRRRRGLVNKAFQAAWALAEEARRSKLDILEEYLSTVYWGLSYHGIDEAASGYFKTTRERLTIAQSFFLVERLANPNSVLPDRVESLLQRNSISEILLLNPETHEELVTLYDEHLRCGDKLHELLTLKGTEDERKRFFVECYAFRAVSQSGAPGASPDVIR